MPRTTTDNNSSNCRRNSVPGNEAKRTSQFLVYVCVRQKEFLEDKRDECVNTQKAFASTILEEEEGNRGIKWVALLPFPQNFWNFHSMTIFSSICPPIYLFFSADSIHVLYMRSGYFFFLEIFCFFWLFFRSDLIVEHLCFIRSHFFRSHCNRSLSKFTELCKIGFLHRRSGKYYSFAM